MKNLEYVRISKETMTPLSKYINSFYFIFFIKKKKKKNTPNFLATDIVS